MKRPVLLLATLLGLWLAACAAPRMAAVQPMLISAPASQARPSVTPLPTIQPPERFIRPPGAPTPTGFVILSGPTLAPEVLAAFNAVPASPTPALANLNPTDSVALITPDASPSATPSAQVALNASPTARPLTATPTRVVALANASATPNASPTTRPFTATPTRVVALANASATPSASPTARPFTATPTRVVAAITPTVPASWQFQRGRIAAPVLLYHRIQPPLDPTRQSPRYSVPPETFEAQLKALKEWGYTSITISQLAEAIVRGAPLPPRPVIFTFDDGYISVYQNAFPLMQKHGFVGVVYILGQNFNDPDFINAEQMREMAAAGWEVGSHSMTHSHLTQNYDTLNLEVVEAKRRIEALTGLTIRSFAYPFGEYDEKVVSKVAAHYTSAVAIGPYYENGPANIFAIRRIEIRYEYSLDDIAAMLPWNTPP